MKWFSVFATFIIFLTILVILVALLISNVDAYQADPYRKLPGLYIVPAIILVTLLVVFFLRQKEQITKAVSKVTTLATNRKIAWLSLLFTMQIILASLCYWIYYNNPKLYVIGDEIERRYVEITEAESKKEFQNIKRFDEDVANDLNFLRYFKQNKQSFKQSTDGNLLANDSVLVFFSFIVSPPGGHGTRAMKVYDKTGLVNIANFNISPGEIETAVQEAITELEKKASLIRNDLIKIRNGNDYRWSYIQFLSYFFREQLQAMSVFLILLDFGKYLIWFSISLLLSVPLWKKKH